MAGVLNKEGSHPGALVQTTIIAATAVPVGEQGEITDFEVMTRTGAVDTVAILQMSNDGFVLNIVEKTRTEMPTSGNFLKTYASPLIIPGGYSYRAVFSQGTAGVIAVGISGGVFKLLDRQLGSDQLVL